MVSEPDEPGVMMVVASHPDDETLGAGATMAKYADAGWEVHATVLGRGLGARTPDQSCDPDDLDALGRQLKRACEVLGVHQLHTFDLPDNRFDQLDLLDVVKVVEGVLDEVRPSVVLTHWHGDLNVDHQVTSRAVVTATRPQPGQPVAEVLSFEVPSATGWRFGAGPAFQPTVYHDVSKTLQRKMDALACYKQEMRDPPHVRSLENLERVAQTRGAEIGVAAAEAFSCVRSVRR